MSQKVRSNYPLVSECIFKVAANQRDKYGRGWDRLKTGWLLVLFILMFLFKIHKRDTATEKELDSVIKMTIVQVKDSRRFKQNAKWTVKYRSSHRKYSVRKGLEISKNSQENISTRVSFNKVAF